MISTNRRQRARAWPWRNDLAARFVLLEDAEDFPKDGPVLVITDGYCDRFRTVREHAILTPPAALLPFIPRCPVFEMEAD